MIKNLPTSKYPAESRLFLSSMSASKENPFNPHIEVHEGDEYWVGELVYKNLDQAQQREHLVFTHSLRGSYGEFWFVDYVHRQLGTWGGTINVDGANQDGLLLNVKGATPSTLIAPAGDRFQLGDHLHELTEDAYSDATGRAQLKFLPDIRVIPADDAYIETANPRVKVMLQKKQEPPQTTTKKALLTSYKYQVRESLR